MQFETLEIEQIYDELSERYKKATLTKKELANEINLSTYSIDKYMAKGYGLPNYKKLGNAKNGSVIFPIIEVAKFLATTIKSA